MHFYVALGVGGAEVDIEGSSYCLGKRRRDSFFLIIRNLELLVLLSI